MPVRCRDAFKCDLEDQLRFDSSYRPKFLDGISLDKIIDLGKFRIGETGIGFGKTHQAVTVSYCESIIGIEISSSAIPFLPIDHDGIDHERIDLPFPPVSPFSSYLVN